MKKSYSFIELVDKIRSVYENADARNIFEHVAIEIDITGEGHGALYLEVANRAVCIEPYNYFDRDGRITIDSDAVVEIVEGRLTGEKAFEEKRLCYEGDFRKLALLKNIIL